MIPEKMLELLLLGAYINDNQGGTYSTVDVDKMIDRFNELSKEFLAPYMIDTTSKED